MKKIIILFSILVITVLQACKKDPSPGDNFDFSNSLAPYVTITSLDDVEVEPGKVASIDLQMRTSLQQKVTVTYKVEGAINIPSATAVFDKEVCNCVSYRGVWVWTSLRSTPPEIIRYWASIYTALISRPDL